MYGTTKQANSSDTPSTTRNKGGNHLAPSLVQKSSYTLSEHLDNAFNGSMLTLGNTREVQNNKAQGNVIQSAGVPLSSQLTSAWDKLKSAVSPTSSSYTPIGGNKRG